MTFQQWYDQTINKPIDIDHAFGDQCVDVYLSYIVNVLGVQNWSSVSGFGDAKDLFAKANSQYFDKLIGITPQQGDVVVFGPTSTNPYGHIAVVVSANPTNMTVIEQNGFNPSGVAYLATRPYNNVIGYLRPKGASMEKVNLATARILAEDILGRDRAKTHAGAYDGDLNANHVGQDLSNAYVFGLWKSPEAALAVQYRQKLQDFYTKYNAVIGDLSSRPTKAEYDAVMAKLATEHQAVVDAQAKLAEAQAQKTTDTQLLDQGKGAFAWLINLINRLKG